MSDPHSHAGTRAERTALAADAVAQEGVALLCDDRDAEAEARFVAALRQERFAPAALKGLGDLARRRGDFAAAQGWYADLLAATPGMAFAQAAAGVLGGRPVPSPPGITVPVPFVLRPDFLPAARRDEAFAYGLERLGEMRDATVVEEGGHEVRVESRRARLLYEPPEIAAWFVPALEAVLPEVRESLGLPAFEPGRIELQMTLHTGGHFYRAHRDVSGPDDPPGEIDGRRISFVYYMSRTPRPFSGGALRLYDSDRGGGDWRGRFWDEHRFSRIEPADNTIVFFPSPAMHEVMPVELDSPDPADGRLTLNGWVHAEA
jgi:hypothetical protein